MKKQTIQESRGPDDSIPRLAYTPAEAGAARQLAEKLFLLLVDRVRAYSKLLRRLLNRLATPQNHLHGLALERFIVLLGHSIQ
jgi:hypothetical protein